MLEKEYLEKREEYVHLIGNLLLTKINKELGQKPFEEKKITVYSKWWERVFIHAVRY